MKILHLSTNDTGGAAGVALRLYRNLAGRGVPSRFLVLEKRSQAEDVEQVAPDALSWLRVNGGRVWSRFSADADHYFPRGHARPVRAILARLREQDFKPDVLVCHWTSRMISAPDLARLAQLLEVPVVWYFHDMNPFTGGCHYAFGCERFTQQCGQCPALHSTRDADLSRRNWIERSRAWRDLDLTGVAYSGYIAQLARRSSLFGGRRIETIMPAIDPARFSPGEGRAAARRRFGWPEGARVILAGSQIADKQRKGGHLLVQALRRIGQAGWPGDVTPMLALVGNVTGTLYDEVGIPVRKLGYVDAPTMIDAYRAADVYVCPSLQDAGPMMVSESISCGTPVVSYDTGIASDLVRNGETGYLARAGDVEDLARGLLDVLGRSPAQQQVLHEHCLRMAREVLHPDVQARRFVALFEDLASRRVPRLAGAA